MSQPPPQHPYSPTPPPRPRKARKWPYVLGGIVVLIIVISIANSGKGTVTTPPADSVAGAPVPGAPADNPAAQSATFGQRFTWPDGLAVTVARPAPFAPSAAAATARTARGRAVLITTTVTNGTGQPYALNPFVIGPKATQGGQDAPLVIDETTGGLAQTTILPGKSYTFKTAFSVGKQVAEMQLEYTENALGSPAIFTGQG